MGEESEAPPDRGYDEDLWPDPDSGKRMLPVGERRVKKGAGRRQKRPASAARDYETKMDQKPKEALRNYRKRPYARNPGL